jgi:hypothetical protein
VAPKKTMNSREYRTSISREFDLFSTFHYNSNVLNVLHTSYGSSGNNIADRVLIHQHAEFLFATEFHNFCCCGNWELFCPDMG